MFKQWKLVNSKNQISHFLERLQNSDTAVILFKLNTIQMIRTIFQMECTQFFYQILTVSCFATYIYSAPKAIPYMKQSALFFRWNEYSSNDSIEAIVVAALNIIFDNILYYNEDSCNVLRYCQRRKM